ATLELGQTTDDWLDTRLRNGIMGQVSMVRIADIRDGTSTTLIVAEDADREQDKEGPWADGRNSFTLYLPINATNRESLFSLHPGGVNGMMADGSVHFFIEEMELDILGEMVTRNGREVIRSDQW
ncbi:MAG: DUF1559 domain-containing protein, partial [Planctomycetota bacterium]|nr:DUF1559 domain-containing protein [Planctomycetota bacterium]